jgi:glycosyltransferase involved in cell wall biosynthesis
MREAVGSARLTVLLPVYNGEPFLSQSIDSLVRQTWSDFELRIIDDGSTDRSADIADGYARRDRRVHVERIAHCGLVGALNHGLDAIETPLVARADADDVCRRDRLARQVAFLDAHQEIGVCGTAVECFPSYQIWRLPKHPDELRATLLFGVPLYHSTVMMRRACIAGAGQRYDPSFSHAEDYDLWERLSHTVRFANLASPLVRYRRHPGQVSEACAELQAQRSQVVRHRQLVALALQPSADELQLHEAVSQGACGESDERLVAGRLWLARLRDANRAVACYPEPAFTRILALRWYRNCAEGVLRGRAVSMFTSTSLCAALPHAWRYVVQLHLLRWLPSAGGRWLALVWNRLRKHGAMV